MITFKRRFLATLISISYLPLHASAEPIASYSGIISDIRAIAPRLSSSALKLALKATSCAQSRLKTQPRFLAVIDYSLPSSVKRFWLLDLKEKKVLNEELVAHGKESGDEHAVRFSNQPGSLQSSLGLFTTAETYSGQHGYSLRLVGLDDGYNDRAYERDIVVHGAEYVSEQFVERQHRLGRSWGCPALPVEKAQEIIDTIKDGAFLFAYYPNKEWLSHSRLLNGCTE